MHTPKPATAKVTLDGAEHVVVFDFDTLCRIETRTGKGVLQIVQEMVGVPDKKAPAVLRVQTILTRVPLAFVGAFVAACVDLPDAAVQVWARTGQLYKAFPLLVQPFFMAAEELVQGMAEDQEDSAATPNPSAAAGSSASEPPRSSSSVSGPVSSPG